MSQRARTSRAPRTDRRVQATGGGSLRIWLIAGGALVLVVAVVLALLLANPSGGASSGEPSRTAVKVTGQPLPSLPQSGADPAVGQKIPTLTGVTFDNSPMTIGPNDGAMIIMIVAHWCPHCQAEVPRVQQWINSGGLPQGVQIKTLSTSISSTQPNYPSQAWLKRENWTPPVLVDDAKSTGLDALGINAFPGFVFVKADGTVAGRTTGELPIDQLAAAANQLK